MDTPEDDKKLGPDELEAKITEGFETEKPEPEPEPEPTPTIVEPDNQDLVFRSDPEPEPTFIPHPTPEEILNQINAQHMSTETQTPETKPAKTVKTPVEKTENKKDYTGLIIGIVALLLLIGLFMWKNHNDKKKLLTDNKKPGFPENENEAQENFDQQQNYFNDGRN